jgi:hypothetical protein
MTWRPIVSESSKNSIIVLPPQATIDTVTIVNMSGSHFRVTIGQAEGEFTQLGSVRAGEAAVFNVDMVVNTSSPILFGLNGGALHRVEGTYLNAGE